ncbi:MAG: Lrp/AsnC family transcriptional regulator [Pseudomonadota bacterium]
MTDTSDMDGFDRKILAALQVDARLSNNELADKIGLSPSQCSRRRARLEETGIITGYHATVDKERAGFGLTSIISVTLSTHNADSADRLAKLFARIPNIQEVNQMTGDMDYYVKVVTPDLKALTKLITEELLAHDAIQNVKTAIVLESLKETSALPL